LWFSGGKKHPPETIKPEFASYLIVFEPPKRSFQLGGLARCPSIFIYIFE
jgi:hypothetical protein